MVDDRVRSALSAFAAEHDRAQFHTPENLAKSISIAAGKLLECFQWSAQADPNRVRKELADVLTSCLLLAHRLGVDPQELVLSKLVGAVQGVTSSEIERLELRTAIPVHSALHNERFQDQPVVYILYGPRSTEQSRSNNPTHVYVGYWPNAIGWIRHCLQMPSMRTFENGHVILNETFDTQTCLALASHLMRMLSSDGSYRVLNRNIGLMESNEDRSEVLHQEFREIFGKLAREDVFKPEFLEIENSDLYKLSPFKILTANQADAVQDIVTRFITDVETSTDSTMLIQGDPGTGKTTLAVYMMKMLLDIKDSPVREEVDNDTRFAEFFTEDNARMFRNFRFALVIPQHPLRDTIKKVFRNASGLDSSLVMTPFEIGEANQKFDLIVVDDTHLLNHRASYQDATLNKKFGTITTALFGTDDTSKTQLDWIRAKSRHRILFSGSAASVRLAELPEELLQTLVADSWASGRYYRLQTQMRTRASSDYVSYIRRVLSPQVLSPPQAVPVFGDYEFRMFDSFVYMRNEIFRRYAEVGLSLLVTGYAWESKPELDESKFDMEVEGIGLRWNSTQTDWIDSASVLQEVGSLQNVQGHDLNYVGVIIGPDLRFNPEERRLWVSRESYFGPKGNENDRNLGKEYSEIELLRIVTQLYTIILTYGIYGTFVYVCDDNLREYLRDFIPSYM